MSNAKYHYGTETASPDAEPSLHVFDCVGARRRWMREDVTRRAHVPAGELYGVIRPFFTWIEAHKASERELIALGLDDGRFVDHRTKEGVK